MRAFFTSVVLLSVAASAGEKVLVEMEVVDVVPMEEGQAVLLAPRNEKTVVPVFVGEFEANAIKLKLARQQPPRPMTHDLLDTTIKALGGKVTRIVIDDLKGGTFLGKLTLEQGGKSIELDARPSDCIALALRAGAPIFAAKSVVDQAGLRPPEGEHQPPRRQKKPQPGLPETL
ncbi:MAG: bifunctional nuclease family protein [Myxococcaceae bacterium]|nr:bifunctional nuclease family protein [Myxococcaceae bacterium]